jgi:A/G-specific adenine glycosylase
VVDTNVGRVLARQMGERLTPARAQALADDAVPTGRSWAWNQAMLDLGALVCTKRSPRCDACPVSDSCCWFLAGSHEPDPAIGSAGVSVGQSRFEGSFRQGRARLLDRLRHGEVLVDSELVEACGWSERSDGERDARRAAETLVRDGLAVLDGQGALRLP